MNVTLPAMLGASALLLTACGSSGGLYGASSSPSPSASPSATGPARVALGSTSAGKVLVDGQGMTLYVFARDTRGRSACTGSCASYWPPVPSSEKPTVAVGAVTAQFGSVKRPDGSSQLTVNGFPVYTYAGDSQPGQASGQGQNLSGGLWWVVSADGSRVTHPAAVRGAY